MRQLLELNGGCMSLEHTFLFYLLAAAIAAAAAAKSDYENFWSVVFLLDLSLL